MIANDSIFAGIYEQQRTFSSIGCYVTLEDCKQQVRNEFENLNSESIKKVTKKFGIDAKNV